MASHNNYSCVAYFGNYQRTSVSIGISEKRRYFTVVRLRADALFFETKFIYSRSMLSSFYFMLLSLFKIVSYGVHKLKGKHASRKIEVIYVSSVAQK